MSSDKIGLPAWLAIEWSESVPIREIQLVFDTGLHRHLTLSQADGYTASMQWGQAQEETVRDYQIDIKTVDGWAEVIKVENNYQRLRRHRLVESDAPALVATALRITVTATNGVNHARICEVRAY